MKAYVIQRTGPALATLDPTDFTITVTGCTTTPPCLFTARASGERVRLVIDYEYAPLSGSVFGNGTTFALSAATEYNVE